MRSFRVSVILQYWYEGDNVIRDGFFCLFVIFGISFFGIFDGGGFPIVGSFSWIFLDFFRDDSRILLLINFSGISRKNATCLKITVIVSLDLSWFIFRRDTAGFFFLFSDSYRFSR